MAPVKVSNSRIKTWRNCKFNHHLKYNLKLEAKKKSIPFERGGVIHECLESYNNGKSWKRVAKNYRTKFYKDNFEKEIVELGDIPTMVEELMENYCVYYEDEDLEHLVNELEFNLPLCKGIEVNGFIDAVVENDKGIWSKEYKTYARDPGYDFLRFNTQSSLYMWALEQLGYKNIQGALWDIITAKTPSKPQLTEKTGKLSLKKLASTPYTVRKGILELGYNPEEYLEFINKHNYNDFLNRHYIRINKPVMKDIMEDFIYSAKEILEFGERDKDKNLGLNCKFCLYKNICQAELMGMDSDYIIKREFKRRNKNNGKKEEKISNKKA